MLYTSSGRRSSLAPALLCIGVISSFFLPPKNICHTMVARAHCWISINHGHDGLKKKRQKKKEYILIHTQRYITQLRENNTHRSQSVYKCVLELKKKTQRKPELWCCTVYFCASDVLSPVPISLTALTIILFLLLLLLLYSRMEACQSSEQFFFFFFISMMFLHPA